MAFINLLDFYMFYNEGMCLRLSYVARNSLLIASQGAALMPFRCQLLVQAVQFYLYLSRERLGDAQ